jgi:hypothetical protein
MKDTIILDLKGLESIYEIVGEWEIKINKQKVRVRAKKDMSGKFTFETDHIYFHKVKELKNNESAVYTFTTKEEALKAAVSYLQKAVMDDGVWIKNRNYY